MRLPERNEAGDEGDKRMVGRLPVDPRNLVVLAVRVVVPTLRASEFVAVDEQRRALREDQRCQEIAFLAAPPRKNRFVIGRPLRTEVPRAVVTLAVATFLTVRFVVLLVVGDQIVEREAIVCRDEIDA